MSLTQALVRPFVAFDKWSSRLLSPVFNFIFGSTDAPNEAEIAGSSVSLRCYREQEMKRITSALVSNSPLLVVGESGSGKTTLARFVADKLRAQGFTVAFASSATPKQTLIDIASQLDIADELTRSTSAQLETLIAEECSRRTIFLICDDAHRLGLGFRCWLERLLAQGQPILLFATHPPAKDVFLKLPRIELQRLPPAPIRALMRQQAAELDLTLSPAQFAELQERCAGNPMLARRVVRESYLGLADTAPDHTEWIDGTPFLVAGLMVFAVLRFIGRGLHQSDLMIIGGVMTVAVAIVRLLIMSLPRKSNKLGK